MMAIPNKRIDVFISSAQDEESGFNWAEIRQKVKNELSKCPFINPFIIEDYTTEIPSNQFYEYQVSRADIIVMLIKNEVRSGTNREFVIARMMKKPLLVYLCQDEHPDLSVEKVKNSLRSEDYCTYRKVSSFDKIECEVCSGVIENIINYYQYQHYRTTLDNDTFPEVIPTSDEILRSSKVGAPTKMVLSYFSSCYENIYEYLDIKYLKEDDKEADSLLHQLGESILRWLIDGNLFYNKEDILTLIENSSEIYDSTAWLKKRWEAIGLRISGKFELALAAEKEALSEAESKDLPSWITNDILIDCRNFEVDINDQKHNVVLRTESQEKLDDLKTSVYLPVLDRYIKEAYEEIIKEEIEFETTPYSTIIIGSNIRQVIVDIENYLFSAVLYGSFTHLVLSRRALARTLYKYGKLTNNASMIFKAIRLYLLNGDTKKFKQICRHEWNCIYSEVTSRADELWHLTENVDIINVLFIDVSLKIGIDKLLKF